MSRDRHPTIWGFIGGIVAAVVSSVLGLGAVGTLVACIVGAVILGGVMRVMAGKSIRPSELVPTHANPDGSVPRGMKLAPAGWYPDPSAERSERYFDGAAWTHQAR